MALTQTERDRGLKRVKGKMTGYRSSSGKIRVRYLQSWIFRNYAIIARRLWGEADHFKELVLGMVLTHRIACNVMIIAGDSTELGAWLPYLDMLAEIRSLLCSYTRVPQCCYRTANGDSKGCKAMHEFLHFFTAVAGIATSRSQVSSNRRVGT